MTAQTIPPTLTPWSTCSAKPAGLVQEYARLFVELFPEWAARCASRIARAVEICTRPGACREIPDQPGMFEVSSASNPRGVYLVDMNRKTCTCPDDGKNQNRNTVICKHRLAIAFHTLGPEWQRDQNPHVYLAKLRSQADEAWRGVAFYANRFETMTLEDQNNPAFYEQLANELRARTAHAIQAEDAWEAFRVEHFTIA